MTNKKKPKQKFESEISSKNYKQFTIGRWPVIGIEDRLDSKVKSPNVNRVIGQPIHAFGFADTLYSVIRMPGYWDQYHEIKQAVGRVERHSRFNHTLAVDYIIDAVMGIVITSDEKIIAEQRSNKVANNPGGISLPAGACEYQEKPLAALKRELYEELNLKPKYIKLLNDNPFTIVHVPQSLTINYIYVIETPRTFKEICRYAEDAKDKWEWSNLISVPYDAKSIRKFAVGKVNGKSSKVALLAFADYLEDKDE